MSLTLSKDRLTKTELDRLCPYLPSSLVEALQFESPAPTANLLERCVAHLSNLLETVCAHLPPRLVEQVAHDPTPGQAGGQFVAGALLFADISGFTAMSEQLSQIGREGAEEITTIFNRLAAEMRQWLGENHTYTHWIEGQCLSYSESVSFYPAREIVRKLLGTQSGDSELEIWSKLRNALARLVQEAADESLPYMVRVYLDQGRREEALAALKHCTYVFERLGAALELAAARTLRKELLA